MQEIPDAGGGVAGFIAWLLWRVYVYFPFEGTWDWLVLFIFLAALTRVGAIPSSRKLIQWVTSGSLPWQTGWPSWASCGGLRHA